jgi:hypothetical protein
MTPEQENRLREHLKVPPVMTLSEVASALRMTGPNPAGTRLAGAARGHQDCRKVARAR